ncbi:MAG: class I SAM-dependent methyltransferase [SAR202 cluster bacterium]|nr:class I SAM-dependent methyltransferase [SAR202 cluster bacterium]
MAQGVVTKHWTQRLFVEHAELYLPFLEKAEERTADEVDALITLFRRHGVPEGGRVLDAACGTGRHAVALAQRGYEVVGLDVSPLYIRLADECAKEAGARARFVEGDVLDAVAALGDERPFDAVISMFNSHGYWGRQRDVRLFGQLRASAYPYATLVVLTTHQPWLESVWRGEIVESAGGLRLYQKGNLDSRTGVVSGDRAYFQEDGDDLKLRLLLDMEHQVYGYGTMAEMLAEAGWDAVEGYGNDRVPGEVLAPLADDSMTMWVVAQATPRAQ